MKHNFLCILKLVAFCCGLVPLSAQAQSAAALPTSEFFIENKGQWPAEVKYLTRIGGMDAWVTDKGITYDFYTFKKSGKTELLKDKSLQEKSRERTGHIIAMRFKNAAGHIQAEAREPQPGYHNYLLGSDESKWAKNVQLFKEVSLLKVYEGIDTRIYLENGSLRYDMVLKAGADPSAIAMTFDGAERISINKKGELVLKTSLGDVVQQKLFAFQNIDGKKKKVECSFAFKKGGVGFTVGKYDVSKPLVIDPLIYSTYIGGDQFENVRSIAVDKSGSAYITGATNSSNYPTTSGAYRSLPAYSLDDVFVTKLSPDGRYLEYSTFIGGKERDMGLGICVAPDSTVYITGYTYSWETGFNVEFPTTPGAFDRTHNSPGGSESDGFVLRLNKFGSDLLYSTFIGGNNNDFARAIAIDRNGNAYIAGETHSNNLPVSATAFDRVLGSNGEIAYDVFVAKFNATGTSLLYLTYLGNTALNTQLNPTRDPILVDDYVSGIAVDASGSMYVAGTTFSQFFPTTAGALDRTIGSGILFVPPMGPSAYIGAEDMFVTKFSPDASRLIYSTFIGGNRSDIAGGIAVDRSGNAYVTGQVSHVFSDSLGFEPFPVTQDAYDNILTGESNDRTDAVLVKLNSTGSALLYSTFIGKNGNDAGNAIALDSSGGIYIAGQTNSGDFPMLGGISEDRTYNGGELDGFAVKFSPTGTMIYSTFLGGSAADAGRSIAVDSVRDAYITGTTLSSDFPIRNYTRSYDSTFNSESGTTDAFISKLRMECFIAIDAGRDTVICPGDSIVIGNPVTAGTGLAPYQYTFTPTTNLVANGFQAVVKPKVTTKYYLTAIDRTGCVVRDSITVTVNPAIIANAGADITTCAGKDTVLGKEATGGSGIFTYKWTPSTGLSSDTVARPRLTPTVTQTYTVVVTDSRGCTSNDEVNIIITNPISFTSTTPATGLDFGELDACQNDDSLTFTITNNSGRIVRVTGYNVSNSAFKVVSPAAGFNLSADPARADAKKSITVKFSPQSSGVFKDSLRLITDPCAEEYTVYLTGRKLESLVRADTNMYNFGRSFTCEAPATRDTVITVRNSGSGEITIKAPSLSAPYALIEPLPSQFPKLLKSGETVLLKVRLTQPTGEGPANAILEVPFESASCPASSITIDLVSERIRTGADIVFKSLQLPDITGCDTYRDTVITFTNTGSESTTLKSMSPVTGVQLLTTLPLAIAAGDTERVSMRFSPDGSGSPVQALFIYGPCNETLAVTLNGSRKGIAFQMPASIQADTVVLCSGTTSSTGSASVTNQSGVDVTLREDAAVTGPFTIDLPKEQLLKTVYRDSLTTHLLQP